MFENEKMTDGFELFQTNDPNVSKLHGQV